MQRLVAVTALSAALIACENGAIPSIRQTRLAPAASSAAWPRRGCSAPAAGCTSRCAHSLSLSGSRRTRAPQAPARLQQEHTCTVSSHTEACLSVHQLCALDQQCIITVSNARLSSCSKKLCWGPTCHEAHSQVLQHNAVRGREEGEHVHDEVLLVRCSRTSRRDLAQLYKP